MRRAGTSGTLLQVLALVVAGFVTTAIAIAVNVATKDGEASWWPTLDSNPMVWVIGLTVAGVITSVLLLVLSRNAKTSEPRALLARRVRLVENQALEATLRDIGRIEVPLTVEVGGTQRPTDVARLASAIRDGEYRRIMLLGGSGAGKTVLSMRLVLELVHSIPSDGSGTDLVPVRLQASTWTEGRDLDEWMVDRIGQDYGIPRVAAVEVVRDRSFIPVVDGLDELDSPVGNRSGRLGKRAASLLSAFNRYWRDGVRAPVVVTFRQERFRAIAEGADKGRRPTLAESVTVYMNPLGSNEIRQFVEGRFAHDAPALQDWRPVLDRLDDVGGRVPRRLLNSPWRLFLAVTVVPAELPVTTLLGDEATNRGSVLEESARITNLLLDRFIPATLGAAADRVRRRQRYARGAGLLGNRYLLLRPHPAPEKVERWLRSLARAQHRQRTDPDSPVELRSHIVAHRTWTVIPVDEFHGMQSRWASWLGWGVSVVGIVSVFVGFANIGISFGWGIVWIVTTVGSAIAGRTVQKRTSRVVWPQLPGAAPVNSDILQQTRAMLVGALIGGLPASLMIASAAFLLHPWRYAVAATLAGGAVAGILSGNARRMATTSTSWAMDVNVATPRRAVRRAVAAAVFHLLARASTSVVPLTVLGPPIWTAVAFALAISTVIFLSRDEGMAVFRYYLGIGLAATRRLLPLRTGRFLAWSAEVGLLRTSGAAYQFRHRELLEWLIRPTAAGDADVERAPVAASAV